MHDSPLAYRRRVGAVVLVLLLGATACGGSEKAATTDAATSTSAAPSDPTTTTSGPTATGPGGSDSSDGESAGLPDGATPGIDDVDGDGEPDPTCGTADLGGGLVVRTLCTSMAPENEDGVIPVDGGPLTLAGTSYTETDEVDVTIRFARDEAGRRVTIFQLGSDTLFDTGSAALRTNAIAALPAVAAALVAHLPDATVTVRGHADSRGADAANQTLSEGRAAAVAAWLVGDGGLAAGRVGSVGLGSTAPAALETNPDGSPNAVGQPLTRRVEIVAGTAG